MPNDCTNANLNSDLDIINALDPFNVSPTKILNVDNNLCVNEDIEEALTDSIDESSMEESMQDSNDFYNEHSYCVRVPDLDNTFSSTDLDIKMHLAKKHNINYDDSFSTVAYERKYMTLDSVFKAAFHQPGVFPLDEVLKKYNWVEYVYNSDIPNQSTMRCMYLLFYFTFITSICIFMSIY